MTKLIFVRWVDSSAPQGTWLYATNIDPTLLQCISVGFLIRETKDNLTIAGHRSDVDDPQYSGVMVIPKSAIIARKLIKGVM